MDYVSRPDYEQRLRKLRETEDIKVLTGVRRCGKSSLLHWLKSDLLSNGVEECNIFYCRLDAFGAPVNPNAEWLQSEISQAISNSNQSKCFYVLLDEIQDVQSWERIVRQLHTRPNTDVYITGSNAYVLSSDLATLIGGRYVEVKVQPLSFAEYLSFAEAYGLSFDSKAAAFAEYLRYGGMPALFHLKERTVEELSQLLRTIYETVILNDVAARTKINDLDLLSKLVRYVFSTSGSLFSTNKITNTLTSNGRKTRPETIDGYLRALTDALILYECEQMGLAGKEILRPQRKFYPVDTGLRNLMRNFAPGDSGFQIENVVHNELTRRGWKPTVGTLRAGEVDFVAEKAQERCYVQVSESIADPSTYERELAPLNAIDDAWPKYVLTADYLNCGTTENGIQIVNIIDWLLAK
ncbi:MAG: ATP-binding protein [Coriobacteriia bacterium]|nr:ATP-binding protein [Coriobacteriia bacterium]